MRDLLLMLDPRAQRRTLALAFLLSSCVGWALMQGLRWPLWSAVGLVLIALIGPLALSWRATWRRDGAVLAVLAGLLYLQSFHGIEHIAQWTQYHVLNYPPKQASGLISPLNAEWVHFVWNWSVLSVLLWLVAHGVGRRNLWAWAMLLWTTAHTAEHSYLMVNYLNALAVLRGQGVDPSFAQGLPGILGSHGWLGQQELPPAGLFICQVVPGLVEAPRLDVHFWWNAGETILLWLAAWSYVGRVGTGRGGSLMSEPAAPVTLATNAA